MTYFKRYRMEISLRDLVVARMVLPLGYTYVAWDDHFGGHPRGRKVSQLSLGGGCECVSVSGRRGRFACILMRGD